MNIQACSRAIIISNHDSVYIPCHGLQLCFLFYLSSRHVNRPTTCNNKCAYDDRNTTVVNNACAYDDRNTTVVHIAMDIIYLTVHSSSKILAAELLHDLLS